MDKNLDKKYLKLLAEKYPSAAAAKSEIINLTAIMSLPKGTEYFFSDIHGEYEAFLNLLRSASGTIMDKIRIYFSDSMTAEEQENFAHLIYFPEETLKLYQAQGLDNEKQKILIFRLIRLCKELSSKYTRSKVRKKLPADYGYAIEELLNVDTDEMDKKRYYDEIINSIIDSTSGSDFITHLCILAQRLAVDKLHIIGDIFDRGPYPNLIMDTLMSHHSVDIQWGNHDISWMGAAAGNQALICNVIRISAKYGNLNLLEDGYGINLRPLSMFAARIYKDDPCERFMPKILDENIYDAVDPGLAAKMHKAITVIQFKVEGQITKRHPDYQINDRIHLEHINFEKETVNIHGKDYKMLDMNFPTIDPQDPLKLTKEEQELINSLALSFRHSETLHRHIRFVYSHGAMYKRCNSNLLYHGCIPMKEDGTFEELKLKGIIYSGKRLLDYLEDVVKMAYFLPDDDPTKDWYRDFMWYLWCGPKSPVYGKDNMATFENYFVADKAAAKENMNPYYKLSEKEEFCNKILKEFGLPVEGSHIINGHVPVKRKDGENPVKCGGKVLVIDGGFSKAYQKETGIAGYTLIFNSYGLLLVAHEPFESTESAIAKEKDIHSETMIVKRVRERLLVGDTDIGEELKRQVKDLERLLVAYRNGELREKR